jgi:predicted RNase H-like HicB family nuclease
MLTEYLEAAMLQARYEILPDDGSLYGEIAGFDGVYANAASLEACRDDLREVLEEWLLLRLVTGTRAARPSRWHRGSRR